MPQKRVTVDLISAESHIISLDNRHNDNFSGFDDFMMSQLMDDVLLVEYIDSNDNGEIQRDGIWLPGNITRNAWRKAKVILVGPNAQYVKKGDIVIFPNDKGINISKIEVDGHGIIEQGRFINEDRLFGICKHKAEGSK